MSNNVTFAGWMGSMWLYTVLRFGVFGLLWVILWAVGLEPILAGIIAAFASVPISYVALQVPRQRFAQKIEQRIAARRDARDALDSELDPDA
jgi:p-aminobenzoyl-glutamate transporter AbgT